MKKIICAAIAAATMLCISLQVFAASDISIKNNVVTSEPVSYSYDAEGSGEIVKSIKPLMTKLDELKRQDSVLQTLTITSVSEGGVPVNFRLRLSVPDKNISNEMPEKPRELSADEYNSLDYYNIKITTAEGEVVYDSAQDEDRGGEKKSYKDMKIGTMNTEENAENKIINITISVNKAMNSPAVATAAEDLDWSIVSDTYERVEEKVETDATGAYIEEPQTTEDPEDTEAYENTDASTPLPENDAKTKNMTISLVSGEYLVGKDVAAGRYKMTGQGKVHVYAPEGVLKTTIALKARGDESANGIEEYVITISDGETIDVDNEATLMPHSGQSILPSPSAATSANGEKASGGTSKSNPKTGDDAPIILVSAVGICALLGAAFIAVKKKQNRR